MHESQHLSPILRKWHAEGDSCLSFLTLPQIGSYFFRKAMRVVVNKFCGKFFSLKSLIKRCFHSCAVKRISEGILFPSEKEFLAGRLDFPNSIAQFSLNFCILKVRLIFL